MIYTDEDRRATEQAPNIDRIETEQDVTDFLTFSVVPPLAR
jgi:hypothetical protein